MLRRPIASRCRSSVVEAVLPGGVIGNTRDFGSLVPGSSPGRVASFGRNLGLAKAFRSKDLRQLAQALSFSPLLPDGPNIVHALLERWWVFQVAYPNGLSR